MITNRWFYCRRLFFKAQLWVNSKYSSEDGKFAGIVLVVIFDFKRIPNASAYSLFDLVYSMHQAKMSTSVLLLLKDSFFFSKYNIRRYDAKPPKPMIGIIKNQSNWLLVMLRNLCEWFRHHINPAILHIYIFLKSLIHLIYLIV